MFLFLSVLAFTRLNLDIYHITFTRFCTIIQLNRIRESFGISIDQLTKKLLNQIEDYN